MQEPLSFLDQENMSQGGMHKIYHFLLKTVNFHFQFITDTVLTMKSNSKCCFHVLQAYLSAKNTPQICILTFQIVAPFQK